jgi:mRNA interferase MazF
MNPKVGEVYVIDLGFEGKVRPVVVVSREDLEAPRALSVVVPLTSQLRPSRYQVKMPRVPWLKLQSYTDAQAMSSVEWHELTDRRGKFDSSVVKQIRDSIRWALEL